MKKNKKEKIKKQETGPKPKLRPWMTAVGAVGVVGVIVGATLLGVFVTGGFEEQVISPEDISFVYDESLFNDAYSQLEITDSDNDGEFSLTLISSTGGVTQNKVNLSFGGDELITTAGGYISNTIIQVPEVVTLGQPFSVKLLKEEIEVSEGSYKDWIKGGISYLIAQSENEDLKAVELKIAVDTPVYSTTTIVYDYSTGREIAYDDDGKNFPVLAGESFSVKSKFIPAKSEYMYADDSDENDISEENRRKKHSFFATNFTGGQSNALTTVYDNQYELHYLAANRVYDEPIAINSYTFKYADKETEFAEKNSENNVIEFYRGAISTLAGPEQANITCMQTANISISPANIGSFTITTSNTDASIIFGKTAKLYLNYNPDDKNSAYLGASVASNTGIPLANMLSNVGIRFTSGDEDAVEDEMISLSEACKTVTYNDNTYYLPNSTGANILYGFWEITASDELTKDVSIEMEIVLFTSTEGTISVYQEDNVDKVINKTLNLIERENYEIAWNDLSSINITLAHNGDGFQEQTINLTDLVTVPEGKDVVFFANMHEGSEIDKVLGATSYKAKRTYYASSSPIGTELELYLLRNQAITLYGTGSFDLYFATVNSTKDVTDDKYIELWCNEYKTISCKEALYQASVTGATIKLPESVTELYAYVGQSVSFSVDFAITLDSYPSFKQAIDNGEEFTINLYDALGNNISQYFNQLSMDIVEDDHVLRVNYSIKDNIIIEGDESEESYNKTALVKSAELVYSGDEQNITWGGSDEFDFENKLYVYNAVAHSIDSTSAVDETGIVVNQSLQSGGSLKTQITYSKGGDTVTPPTDDTKVLSTFIGDLTGVITITDQHDNPDSLDGQWTFVTDNDKAISINTDGKGFTFKNADGEEATIEIKSLDGNAKIGKTYKLSLSTTGVQSLKYDDDATGGCDKLSTNTSAVSINLTGAQGRAVTLANLIEFYIDAKGTEEYKPKVVTYALSSTTLAAMSDTQKKDLFGTSSGGGWLKATDNKGVIYYNVDNKEIVGDTTNIKTITLNQNFAESATLIFNIVAEGINTTLTFTIDACTSIKGENSYEIYAASIYDDETITNTVSGTEETLLSLYEGTQYIVSDTSAKYGYILSEYDTGSVGQIVAVDDEKFVAFYDFWDKESETYKVHFAPDGDNYYGLGFDITFTVLRNVEVTLTKDKDFVIYSTDNSGVAQSISDFLTVGRKYPASAITNEITYTTSQNNILTIKGDTLQRANSTIIFQPGETYKEEIINAYVDSYYNSYYIGQVTIKVKLVENIYTTIADAIAWTDKQNSSTNGNATIQTIDGIKYIVIDNTLTNVQWTTSMSFENGSASLYKKNHQNISTSLYTIVGSDTFSPQTNGAMLGLNANYTSATSADYIIARFGHQGIDGVQELENAEWVYIPAIVTNVGDAPVKYETADGSDNKTIKSQAGKENAIEDYTERYLDVALMTPDELIENGIYDEITAGSSKSLIGTSLFNRELSRAINTYNGEGASNSLIANKLVKHIDNEGNLELYDLANNENDFYYVSLKFTLTSAGQYKQDFYYLLKVNANRQTKVVYPYGGSYENLQKPEDIIDLNETFGVNTLANGKVRFNVYDLEKTPNNLNALYSNYIDQIIQVSINDVDVYTTADAWKEFIDITLDNSQHKITYSVKTTKPLKFVVRRTYVTADDRAVEQIVDGAIDYVFALNDNAVDYSVRFVQEGDNPSTTATETSFTTTLPDEFENTTYTVSFRNGDSSIAGLTSISFLDDEIYNCYTGLKVFLVENAVVGSADSGTVVYDKINIQHSKTEGDEDALVAYSYDNSKEGTGEFTLTLADYINQDTKITFVAFTTYGHSATIVFDIKANASVDLQTAYEDKEINGGSTPAFGELYSVKLNGSAPTSVELTELVATENGKTSNLVTFSGNTLATKDIATDHTVQLTFTIKLNGDNNKTFTFTETFTLKANVKVKTETQVRVQEVIAGSSINGVSYIDFFETAPKMVPTDSDTTITTSSSAVNTSATGFALTNIVTNYVNAKTDATLNITFTLNSGEKVTAQYKFTVVPAVKITANYPDPDDDGTALAMEYVENELVTKLTYNYFFGSSAPFANNNARIAIFNGEVATGETKATYTQLAEGVSDNECHIYLTSLSNAKLNYTNGTPDLNDDIEIKVNEEIKIWEAVVFIRGDIATSPAIVVLTVEYKGVSQTYTIHVSDVLYSASGNFVTNNTATTELGGDTVTAETIYVDKTETTNIFADDRMAKIKVSANASEGEYYLVFAEFTETEETGDTYTIDTSNIPVGTILTFSSNNTGTTFTYKEKTVNKDGSIEYKDKTITQQGSFVVLEGYDTVTINGVIGEKYTLSYYSNFYASYPLYIKQTDIGKSLTVDLGISMSEKTFYSAVLVSKAEDADIGLETTTRKMQVITTSGTTTTTTDVVDGHLTDIKSSAIESLNITNRVQLYYGETISRHAVASKNFDIDDYAVENVTGVKNKVVSLKVGDSEKVTFDYFYIPDIDITISSEAQASALGNYITLEASQEYESLSRLFGIKHPTTGLYLSPADGDIINLSMEVVADTIAKGDSGLDDIYNVYAMNKEETETTFFKTKTNDKQYLYFAQVVNASKGTYDFYLLPQGAKNNGDFVLIKINYSIEVNDDDFERTYFVVVKIMPDYTVQFDSYIGKTQNGVISNQDNPYIIKDTETDGTYTDFTLAGGENGYLSVKHKNGNNTSKEVSVSNFNITLTEGDVYNNSTNIASKLSDDLTSTSWTETSGVYEFNKPADPSTTTVTFAAAKQVVFGDQYYYIEGVDDFGFKYQVYFKLQSTGNIPVSKNDLYITEGEYFDLGLEYKLLSYDSTTKQISSETKVPIATSEYKLINIAGIEAYLTDEATMTAITTAGVINENSPYYGLPDMAYVEVTKIQIDDNVGESEEVTSSNPDATPFATSENLKWQTLSSRKGDKVWQMPKISGDAYAGGTVAKVKILITFEYSPGAGNTEIYTLTVDANVSRKAIINLGEDNIVQDGTAFTVENHITSSNATIAGFIDDTLEVSVMPGKIGKFKMSLNGAQPISISLTNTGSGAYTTFYLSLSEQFGVNVKEGNSITISEDENIDAFYYRNTKEEDKEFTVGTITNDTIYIENANLLNNDNIADVTKHYVARVLDRFTVADPTRPLYVTVKPNTTGKLNLTLNGTTKTISQDNSETEEKTFEINLSSYFTSLKINDQIEVGGSEGISGISYAGSRWFYNYRVSRTYAVTGQYYDMETAYEDSVGAVIDKIEEQIVGAYKDKYLVEFADWAESFNLLSLEYDDDSEKFKTTSSVNKDATKLHFELVNDGKSSIGKVYKIDVNGNIYLDSPLELNEYLKIKISLVVSGPNRSINKTDDEDYTFFELGTVNVAPKSTYTPLNYIVSTPSGRRICTLHGEEYLTETDGKKLMGYANGLSALDPSIESIYSSPVTIEKYNGSWNSTDNVTLKVTVASEGETLISYNNYTYEYAGNDEYEISLVQDNTTLSIDYIESDNTIITYQYYQDACWWTYQEERGAGNTGTVALDTIEFKCEDLHSLDWETIQQIKLSVADGEATVQYNGEYFVIGSTETVIPSIVDVSEIKIVRATEGAKLTFYIIDDEETTYTFTQEITSEIVYDDVDTYQTIDLKTIDDFVCVCVIYLDFGIVTRPTNLIVYGGNYYLYDIMTYEEAEAADLIGNYKDDTRFGSSAMYMEEVARVFLRNYSYLLDEE